MVRTKIGSILRFMTGEIYEYIENFAEEMFVLDWCMNGGTDILHFLFNR